jgi:hypothetical protein
MSAQRQLSRTEDEPRYDPATVIAGTAFVIEVLETSSSEPLAGVHVRAKFHSEVIDVYLGPSDFLRQFEIEFPKGERFHMIGSRVRFHRSHVLLAREVRKGHTTLYLRDRQGHPNWNISRRKNNPAPPLTFKREMPNASQNHGIN